MPNVAAVALERRGHLLGHQIEERPPLRVGRHDVIDGRERALGKRDAPAVLAQHVERLRARDFVDEVQADEQLRLSARQRADGVRVPDFLKECSAMCSFDAPACGVDQLEYIECVARVFPSLRSRRLVAVGLVACRSAVRRRQAPRLDASWIVGFPRSMRGVIAGRHPRTGQSTRRHGAARSGDLGDRDRVGAHGAPLRVAAASS